jgi:hypothetical protein
MDGGQRVTQYRSPAPAPQASGSRSVRSIEWLDQLNAFRRVVALAAFQRHDRAPVESPGAGQQPALPARVDQRACRQ